jgi:hypothetical protein
VTALVGHGLRIDRLTEHDSTVLPQFPWLGRGPDGTREPRSWTPVWSDWRWSKPTAEFMPVLFGVGAAQFSGPPVDARPGIRRFDFFR